MFTLVKIRAKYLKRHPCRVYCSYFFIPTIIIIVIIIVLVFGSYHKPTIKEEEQNGKILMTDQILFDNNKDFSYFENEISFVTENLTDCNILKDIIKKDFKCEKEEKVKDRNIIKIIKKKGKYNIQYFQYENISYFYNYLFNTERFTDPFVPREMTQTNNFIQIQSILSQFLIKKEKGENNPKKNIIFDIGLNSYPKNTGDYSDVMGSVMILGVVVCLQFSMTTYFFNMRMIDEKEKKLTILLERQGLSKKSYFFSWMLSYLFMAIIPLISFFLFYAFFIYLHTFLYILNMLLYLISLFSYSYFMYVCISTTKTAAIVIKFFNFSSAILGFPITYPQLSKGAKILLAFLPQVNFYLCSNSIDKLHTFKSLSWDIIWLQGNKISFMETIIMYIVDILFYAFLSIFIEKYKNSGLPFLLFVKSLFTKVSRNIDINLNENNNDNHDIVIQFERHFQDLSPVNERRKEQNDCLRFVNISKKFDTLKAVNNFNGELFGNEIFCLLGHNGAGKTTLINMISGIYDPTKGDILYKGKSIITDKDYLFQNIGVCQQEDIYFDYLTVSEHLEYMCQIKGGNININENNDLMVRIGLAEKSTSFCKSLSGGQKRKLCTALALIGNSKIILLDEPTSGMDPIAKKSLWNFLKGYQKDKIILLTTHSLDEAEYLGDRIGIMSDGNLICCGTSSYLKSKYPCGFNINLIINPKIFDENKKKLVLDNIKTFEENAEIKIASKGLFSINIQSTNENVDKIFSFIEQSKKEYGIEDYTVSSTSLEDVFLKINNKSNLNDMKYISCEKKNEEILVPENLVSTTNWFSQLISQLQRNFLTIKRNKIVFILEFLSGLGIIYIFVFLFYDLINGLTNSKLDLLSLLQRNDIFIYEQDSIKNYLKNSYVYKSSNIELKKISDNPENVLELISLGYKKASAHISESNIAIKKDNETAIRAYVGQLNVGYFFANIMFTVSAFLKNEYDIDAKILYTMELKKEMSIGDETEVNGDTIGILVIVCFGSVFGYVIFLGGLINEKIKERKTNIKHLLYLSGANSWSYWLAFFIIDYVKLLIYTILLIIPIYYVSSKGGYYFLLNLLTINISSLIFIYFISFLGENAESGVKFLFVLLFGFIVGLIGLFFFAIIVQIVDFHLLSAIYNSFSNSYNFTIFDITPVTSILLSFGRILYGIATYAGQPLHKHGPLTYLYTSFLVQLYNFIFYFILLVLMETGYLRQFFNYLKLKFCISEQNFVFSVEQASDEFLIFNDITNPLILNQMDNNQNNYYNSYSTFSSSNYNSNSAPMNSNNPIIQMQNNNYNSNSNFVSSNYNSNSTPMNNNIQNSNNINVPSFANNNQNNLNNNNQISNNDYMNKPIYGSNILNNLDLPLNDNTKESINSQNNNSLIINNSINNSNLNQPLLGDNINSLNSNSNYNSNYNINYNSNNAMPNNINNAMNPIALPETNMTYNVRKGNPFINAELDKMNSRKDLTTRIEGLKKTFWLCCKKNVRAIDNLYLGLEANEKFGLLGFNGSGKTTTFKSITNEILFDYGKITLFDHDSRKEFEKIRTRIGYCPQENPLFEFMKVREILEFYSKLKTCNIPYQTICDKFGLSKYLETYCIHLSGGNKRKLTFAIAIMNRPTLLLLDEPSTGVDPESRRFMWKNINELSNTGHQYNMILTTHSMEEAEVLCDRVSWLKRGNFVCLGNPENLKLRYSIGYKLHIKFNDDAINANQINLSHNIQEVYKNACNLIVGFSNYSLFFLNTPQTEPFIRELIIVINRLRSLIQKFILVDVGKDLSFNLIISIIPDKKHILFTEILGMKNNNKSISEMIISMESLENILTSFR